MEKQYLQNPIDIIYVSSISFSLMNFRFSGYCSVFLFILSVGD